MNVRSLLTVLLLAAATPALATDGIMAGSWMIKIRSPQGTRTPSMVLTQDGNKLSGTYRGMRGEAPISGIISGNDFDLTVKITSGEATLVVEYKGVMQGDALSGKVLMGRLGEAGFTGARAPK
jgi:hypothetical protein